jgi:hypothetical protein
MGRGQIGDQISAIRKKEKAYAEVTESAEFAEKRKDEEQRISGRSIVRAHP